MNTIREDLLYRMIRIYGFENPITVRFAELCESYPNNKISDEMLTILVEAHEAEPQIFEEE